MTEPIKHTGKKGTAYGWYTLGCKCPECEAAAKVKKRKHRPSGRKPGENAEKPLPDHGTRARYARGCKCSECTEANRLAHYFYKDGTPKMPRRKSQDQPTAVQQAPATKVKEKAARAKPLRIVGVPDGKKPLPKALPRTYVPLSVVQCGMDLGNGGFCMRHYPCTRPGHQEEAS